MRTPPPIRPTEVEPTPPMPPIPPIPPIPKAFAPQLESDRATAKRAKSSAIEASIEGSIKAISRGRTEREGRARREREGRGGVGIL